MNNWNGKAKQLVQNMGLNQQVHKWPQNTCWHAWRQASNFYYNNCRYTLPLWKTPKFCSSVFLHHVLAS